MNDKIKKFMDGAIDAIASVRAGFFFAFIGMVAQVTHIWLLAYQYSSFEGTGAIIQAWILSIALGGGLLFFTVRAGNPGRNGDNIARARERYNKTANAFAVFEAFINLYYWANKIVFIPGFEGNSFNPSVVAWHQLFIAVPFAIAIPVVLKQYAGEIRLQDQTGEDKKDKKKIDELENQISITDAKIDSFIKDITKQYETLEQSNHQLISKIEDLEGTFPSRADFSGLKNSTQPGKKQTKGTQSPTSNVKSTKSNKQDIKDSLQPYSINDHKSKKKK